MDKMCDGCHMMGTPTAEGKCPSCSATMSHDEAGAGSTGAGDMGSGSGTTGTDVPTDSDATDTGMGGNQQ
jgi:hypothetical protein